MAICPCRGMDGGMYAVHVIFFTLTLFVVSYARPPLAVHFPYHLKAKQKYCAAQLTVVDCAKPPNFPTSEIYPVCCPPGLGNPHCGPMQRLSRIFYKVRNTPNIFYMGHNSLMGSIRSSILQTCLFCVHIVRLESFRGLTCFNHCSRPQFYYYPYYLLY